MVLSATPSGLTAGLLVRQSLFLLVALLLVLGAARLNIEALRLNRFLVLGLFILTVGVLAAVLFFGTTLHGSRSWFSLGSLTVQPAEFAKIVLILVLAKYFSYRHIELYRAWHIFGSFIYAGIFTLLVLQQPDLGTALLIFLTWVGIMVMAGLPFRRIALVALAIAALAAVSWFFLAPYQQGRILTYLDPGRDPLGEGYSQLQSQIAIGAGGLTGTGLADAFQTRYGFLPAPQNDFIFAAFTEAFGAAGGLAVIGLFSLLVWRLLDFAFRRREEQFVPPSNFGRLFAAGLAILIAIEAAVNILMNLGLLPVTGVPLPFVSYGGSHLLAFYVGLGLYQSFYRRTR